MKYLAIIQARLGSSRLPGKVLKKLEGITVLEHVINRVNASKNVEEVVIATSIDTVNIPIVQFCSNKAIRVFCGSEDDVLDRFYQLSKLIKPKNIVRITADCPMIDPMVIDEVIEAYENTKVDYASNTLEETYPDGEDVEVFSFQSLEYAWNNAKLLSDREHVTPYIKTNTNFKHYSVSSNIDYSMKRWTIDQQEDYIFMEKIFKNLYPINKLFGMKEVLEFLEQNKELENINKGIIRNEGYLKSLKNDKIIN